MKNHQRTRFKKLLLMWVGVSIFLFPGVEHLHAESLRDPTLPPVPAGPANSITSEKSYGPDRGPLTIVVRDGRRYVVMGTRLYAQGQKFGAARIERISETEVWFLEKGLMHKVSRFPGIERRGVAPVAARPVCTASSTTRYRSAICADLRP